MSTYVLVHGSWSDSRCWEKLVPLLERAGHRVRAPDLPGHGPDRTPISLISLQSYVDRILQVLDSQSEPVVLVGHSHGGVVITQTAEQRPDKVRMLVYVCAYLPRNGESLIDLARTDPGQLVLPNLIVAEDQSYALLRDEAIRECFWGDCSDEDVTRALCFVVPEPLASPATPVQVTDARFGRIPRVYIECLRDRAISPALQKRMYTAVPCRQVITMDTSHSPFISAPEELAGHLLSLDEGSSLEVEQAVST